MGNCSIDSGNSAIKFVRMTVRAVLLPLSSNAK
jgi:hypothetical protein